MTPNVAFVRYLVGVVIAIALITAGGLALGRQRPPLPAYVPAPTVAVTASPLELGTRLFETKGCVACHSIDGSPRVGPSLRGRWATPVVLAGGATVMFDEAYMRESLATPQAKSQPGYPPSMPTFDGMLKEREIAALVAYVQSL